MGLFGVFVIDANLPVRLAGVITCAAACQYIFRLELAVVEIHPDLVRYRAFFRWFEFGPDTKVDSESIGVVVRSVQNLVLTPIEGRKLRIPLQLFGPVDRLELTRLVYETLGDDTRS